MTCDICGRGSCANWMHSLEEQERYDKRIEDLFDKGRILRFKLNANIADEEHVEKWRNDDNY